MSWGKAAISIKDDPKPEHMFNFSVVGRARYHPNEEHMAPVERLVVKLNIGAYRPDSGYLLFQRCASHNFLVDTGATQSILRGEVAESLGLVPVKPFYAEAVLANGQGERRLWDAHRIGIPLGTGAIDIRVWFPVVKSEDDQARSAWGWDKAALDENLLGMRDVLERWMLCFTPEALFVFEKLPAKRIG
jgi:gag-polyprotein putative aspartyl protease